MSGSAAPRRRKSGVGGADTARWCRGSARPCARSSPTSAPPRHWLAPQHTPLPALPPCLHPAAGILALDAGPWKPGDHPEPAPAHAGPRLRQSGRQKAGSCQPPAWRASTAGWASRSLVQTEPPSCLKMALLSAPWLQAVDEEYVKVYSHCTAGAYSLLPELSLLLMDGRQLHRSLSGASP